MIPRPDECAVPPLTREEVFAYYEGTSGVEVTVLAIEGFDRIDPDGDDVGIDGLRWVAEGVVDDRPRTPGLAPTQAQAEAIAASLRQSSACSNAGDILAVLRLFPEVFLAYELRPDISADDEIIGFTDEEVAELAAGPVEMIPPAEWITAPRIRELRLVNDTLAVAVVTTEEGLGLNDDRPAAIVIWLVFEDGLWKPGTSITTPFPDPDPGARAREEATIARERAALAATPIASPAP